MEGYERRRSNQSSQRLKRNKQPPNYRFWVKMKRLLPPNPPETKIGGLVAQRGVDCRGFESVGTSDIGLHFPHVTFLAALSLVLFWPWLQQLSTSFIFYTFYLYTWWCNFTCQPLNLSSLLPTKCAASSLLILQTFHLDQKHALNTWGIDFPICIQVWIVENTFVSAPDEWESTLSQVFNQFCITLSRLVKNIHYSMNSRVWPTHADKGAPDKVIIQTDKRHHPNKYFGKYPRKNWIRTIR